MKIYYFVFLAIPWFISSSFVSSNERWFCEEQKYSYQIEVFNTRSQIQVPSDFCDILTSNRKVSEDNVIQLYPNVRLTIFSHQKIEGGLKEIKQIEYKY
jgi:hypothetical protein